MFDSLRHKYEQFIKNKYIKIHKKKYSNLDNNKVATEIKNIICELEGIDGVNFITNTWGDRSLTFGGREFLDGEREKIKNLYDLLKIKQTEDKIINFINTFIKFDLHGDVTNLFTNNHCSIFSYILFKEFQFGEIWWDSKRNHSLFKYKEYYFDITGLTWFSGVGYQIQ